MSVYPSECRRWHRIPCNQNHNYVGPANTTLFLYSRALSNFNIVFVLRENPVTSLYLNGQVNKFPLDLNAT